MALKLRRGTEAQRIITPEQGELIYVTDTKKVYVGDGATVGGILVGPVDSSLYDLVSDTTPQLGGNLDLNGRDITGTGNININGTITATGSINLGNGVEDNINVGGLISSSLSPSVDDAYNLGSVDKQWANVWATQINVDTTLTVGSQIVKQSNNTLDSSTILWDAETDTLYAREFVGNVTGSVFADDSGVLVDGVAGLIVGDVDNNTTTSGNFRGATVILEGRNIVGDRAGIRINTDGNEDDGYDLFTISGSKEAANGLGLFFNRTRGTLTSPAALQANDSVASMFWTGADADANLAPVAFIKVDVDGTPGTALLPGRINFGVVDTLGNLQVPLSVGSDLLLTVTDQTVSANSGSGSADVTGGVIKYLKINVGGTEYAFPLYGLVP